MNQIVSCDQYGSLLYLDIEKRLYYVSQANQGEAEYIMDFFNVHRFFVTKKGELYYFTKDGVLGGIRMVYEQENGKSTGYYSNTVLRFFNFITGSMAFKEGNTGVYFHYSSGHSSVSLPALYSLTLESCTFLGYNNLPVSWYKELVPSDIP